jgi:hypothetical protein
MIWRHVGGKRCGIECDRERRMKNERQTEVQSDRGPQRSLLLGDHFGLVDASGQPQNQQQARPEACDSDDRARETEPEGASNHADEEQPEN